MLLALDVEVLRGANRLVDAFFVLCIVTLSWSISKSSRFWKLEKIIFDALISQFVTLLWIIAYILIPLLLTPFLTKDAKSPKVSIHSLNFKSPYR
jgi:hypothetical protein